MSAEKNNWPKYIKDALIVFKPPERLSVSEWADRYRILGEKDSASPGLWKTERTPYLKEPMNAFNNPEIKDITFVGGTQLGKTVLEQNMISFAVDQDPGPMMIIYPTDKLAEFTSENRLKPMFKLSPALVEKFHETESQRLELQFQNMYIALVGANSPSNLSSRPVRYIFLDEVDKFPKWAGDEAGPIALAEERTKTFWNKKIVKVSSPTLKSGNIWKSWLNADLQMEFHVPCPHCGKMQPLVFKPREKGESGGIKWPKGIDNIQKIRYAAYYECAYCKERIDDRHKMSMLRLGHWVAKNNPQGRVHSVAYHLNSLYSPWVTFGDIAAKFVAVKDVPEELMNFINSWLAEPWENKASRMNSDVIMEKQCTHSQGIVPEKAQLLTVGVDVQLDHFWWGVRAWGPNLTSWLVDYGRAETWSEIETILDRNYPDINGEIHNINLCCMDSGYNTDDVYQFCAKRSDVCVPTKGASRKMASRYNITILEKGIGAGLRLYLFDSGQFKDFISGRLSIATGDKGSWNVYSGIDRRYCDQVCAEQKVEQRDKKGVITTVWEKISSHAQNHMLDVETNNALAAEILGVRYLSEPEQGKQEELEKQESKEEDWIEDVGDNWI